MKTTITLLILLFSLQFWAQTDNSSAPTTQGDSSDKLDIQKLEEKYWSVKDDDFTVVQNRAFTKAKRVYVSLGMGRMINDGYLEGNAKNLSLGWYQSERWGYEFSYQTYETKTNAVTKEFQTTFGASPNYNTPQSSMSLGVIFVPFYAKVSLLEKSILYFDMSVALNLGNTNYISETDSGGTKNSASHYGLDITQTLFINEHWAVRFDIRNKWSSQQLLRYQIPGNQPESYRDLGTSSFQDTNFLLGFTYFH